MSIILAQDWIQGLLNLSFIYMFICPLILFNGQCAPYSSSEYIYFKAYCPYILYHWTSPPLPFQTDLRIVEQLSCIVQQLGSKYLLQIQKYYIEKWWSYHYCFILAIWHRKQRSLGKMWKILGNGLFERPKMAISFNCLNLFTKFCLKVHSFY